MTYAQIPKPYRYLGGHANWVTNPAYVGTESTENVWEFWQGSYYRDIMRWILTNKNNISAFCMNCCVLSFRWKRQVFRDSGFCISSFPEGVLDPMVSLFYNQEVLYVWLAGKADHLYGAKLTVLYLFHQINLTETIKWEIMFPNYWISNYIMKWAIFLWSWNKASLRSRRLEVVGTRKNGRAGRRRVSLARARYRLSPTTSKRLLRRLK